jgi:SAM-dependent methyltransferase
VNEAHRAPSCAASDPVSPESSPNNPAIRFVRPIFPVHRKPDVEQGIFARLDDAIRAELAVLSKERLQGDKILLQAFLNWAFRNLDADAYAAIQTKFIDVHRRAMLAGEEAPNIGRLKFLNFTHYARNKMAQLHRLGLHRKPAKRILDIGCGPGHFQFIAKYFGHEAIGLDLPFLKDHVYNRLCEFFGVSKVDHQVEAMQALPSFAERFDLVTVFLTQFDFHYDRPGNCPWGAQSWRFFVDDICDNLLKPRGLLYFTLTSAPRPPDVLQYFQSVSTWTHKDRVVLIRRDRRKRLAKVVALSKALSQVPRAFRKTLERRLA